MFVLFRPFLRERRKAAVAFCINRPLLYVLNTLSLHL